jgi:hypothetical protein
MVWPIFIPGTSCMGIYIMSVHDTPCCTAAVPELNVSIPSLLMKAGMLA